MKIIFKSGLLIAFFLPSSIFADPCNALRLRTYVLSNPEETPKVTLKIGYGFQSISINGRTLSARSSCVGDEVRVFWGGHTPSFHGEIRAKLKRSDCPNYLGLYIYESSLNDQPLNLSFLETPGLYDSRK